MAGNLLQSVYSCIIPVNQAMLIIIRPKQVRVNVKKLISFAIQKAQQLML